MSGTKFYVWGGGRWREISASGHISGWGRAEFVSATCGRLKHCRRGAVLRGLEALAAGRPTTVHDGPPLPEIRLQRREKITAEDLQQTCKQCRHCKTSIPPALASNSPPLPLCALGSALQLSTEEIFSRLLKSTVTTGTQCSDRIDAGVQVLSVGDTVPTQPRVETTHVIEKPSVETTDLLDLPLLKRKSRRDRKREGLDENQNDKKVYKPKSKRNRQEELSQKYSASVIRARSASQDCAVPRKRSRLVASSEIEEPLVCKELVIEEEDVALLRRFVEMQRTVPFPIDLVQFDKDDEYKRRVFFRLNPIVNVARSRRIQRMLRERRSRTRESQVTLKDFASILGLQSVEEPKLQDTDSYRTRHKTRLKRKHVERCSHILEISDADMENAIEPLARSVRMKKVDNERISANRSLRADMASNCKDERRKVNKVKSLKKTSLAPTTNAAEPASTTKRSNGREYSALEDAAVVQWVADEGRARLVNGNRLWRELQPLHHQRTGCFRSWHSLRNRYLRSLLPRLALHVSAEAATRMRADAVIGELKTLKSKKNSNYNEVRVLSAWSRRPRPPVVRTPSPLDAHSLPRFTPSPPGARSSSASSEFSMSSRDALKPPPTHERTRGERQYASKEETKRALRTRPTSPQRALRSSAVRSPQNSSTPTYSELTRRFASRSSHSSRSPRLSNKSHSKTRRLYNPNLLM